MKLKVSIASVLLFSFCAGAALAQNATKRNGRPGERPATPSPASQTTEKTAGTARYTWEFTQREFVINHILIEHDSSGRGQITFEHRSEEIPIVEPIELSSAALARINALWTNLQFLDSNEDYQSSKNFAHLGTYRLGIEDGKRKRTAEFNWSSNKNASNLAAEYRRAADQAILVFNLRLARDLQPLNVPSYLNEMESLLGRNALSDAKQLVPLLSELKIDEHIPLIARNQADRILKKIAK